MENRIAEFEKVSWQQFKNASMGSGAAQYLTESELSAIWDHIQLPVRGTAGSAGYDIRSPFHFGLMPGASIIVPTGLRVRIDEGWFLACLPRSGSGFKFQVRLANTAGVIDSDYCKSENKGHIFVKLVNGGEQCFTVEQGDGIVQGIFLPFGLTYSDAAAGGRNVGFGSTGR